MTALFNIGMDIHLWVRKAGPVRSLVSPQKTKREFIQMLRRSNIARAATDNDYRVAPPEVKAVKLMNIVVNRSIDRFTEYVIIHHGGAQVVITPSGYIDQLTLPLNNENEMAYRIWEKLRRVLLVGASCLP